MIAQAVIDRILKHEGGYVDDPLDSGGETNYGITLNVARAYGYRGSMRSMSKNIARAIYRKRYWDSIKGDRIAALSPKVAAEVVDTGVNMGTSRAVKFLQRSLNVLNVSGALYDDVTVDGVMGNITLYALSEYLLNRNADVLVRALNCLQGAAYIQLAEKRAKDERFVYGWLKERVKI